MAQPSGNSGIPQDDAGLWYRIPHRVPWYLLSVAFVFILAALARFWAAPFSSGPDVVQFWAFAQTFDSHGLDFYQYAEATDGSFPYWGWAYVYPPLWILILWLGSLATPEAFASTEFVSESWRLVVKTPIILADLAIGALIFWAVPGSKWKKLLFAGIWLLHPTGWYESAVFGQFDAIAAAFLLASVILFSRSNFKLGFLFAGLALVTKQHTLLPIVLMMIVVLRQLGVRKFTGYGMITAGVVILFSLPFVATGNFGNYIDSVVTPGWDPDCQRPLCYAFSGSASLFTYLHDNRGWDTCGWLHYNTYVLAFAMLVALAITLRRKITVAQAALVGMLLFIAINYQINYQYLVIYIPLAILVAAQATSRWQRVATLVLALLPAVWLWLYDVSFWFWSYQPQHPGVISYFDKIGWVNYLSSDWPYVVFAVSLTIICIFYVSATFIFWAREDRVKYTPEATVSAGMLE